MSKRLSFQESIVKHILAKAEAITSPVHSFAHVNGGLIALVELLGETYLDWGESGKTSDAIAHVPDVYYAIPSLQENGDIAKRVIEALRERDQDERKRTEESERRRGPIDWEQDPRLQGGGGGRGDYSE